VSEKIMVNRANDLKRMLAPLEKMINYKAEFTKTFSGGGNKTIAPAYRMMKEQLLALAPTDGKKVNVTNPQKVLVRQAAEAMVAVVTSGPISRYFKDFAEIYLPLLNNWNRQLGKSRSINALTKACERILNDMMTAKDTTDVMLRATKNLRELLRYKPAGFELSRAYLKTLQKDIERKETKVQKKAVSTRVDNVKVGAQQC